MTVTLTNFVYALLNNFRITIFRFLFVLLIFFKQIYLEGINNYWLRAS